MATNNTASFPSFTVTARGEDITFTSAFATLADAYKALAAAERRSDFADDLLARARARQLSPKQAAWLHKLATDSVRPTHSNLASGIDLSAIVVLFETAAEAGKKFPKIDLGGVTLKRAGSRSKLPGTVNILVEGDTWAGRINLDGTVQKSAGWTDEVQARLLALAADPAKVTSQHGIATGACCFCGIALSTAESRSVGYGPICADKFGLPWGDTTAADAADEAATFEGLDTGPVLPPLQPTHEQVYGPTFRSDGTRNYRAGD